MFVVVAKVDFGVFLGALAILVGVAGILVALVVGRDQIGKMKEINSEQLTKIDDVYGKQMALVESSGVQQVRTVEDVGQRELEKVEDVRQQLDSTLRELRGEVATRYIGRFPDFIKDIVDVIGKADEQLTIFCDLPAYGVVSNPKWFERYTDAIQDRVRDDAVDVRMVHLDQYARMAGLASQFGKPWAVTREEPRVAAFVEARGYDIKSVTQRDFFELVEQEQVKALEAFKATAQNRKMRATQTDAIMPLYFWIAGKTAVFALTQFQQDEHEAGFRTTSENLIHAMSGIYDRYVATAENATAG